MKKIYVIATALFLGANIQAQTLVNFESFGLTPESFDNGSAGGGTFNISPITLNNIYNVDWASWDGFSISNITDNTTAGWGNQYSAFPGSGSGGSATYAMAYRIPEMDTEGNFIIKSFDITNATYSAISMRDGDTYGKQFGSVNDASGSPDGTNGEDFFKVWVIGSDGLNKDSVEFYLADYRFADNAQDYIVDMWETIDLSSLSVESKTVSFRFESSDMSGAFLNTPTYFAMDNVVYEEVAGIEENNLDVSVYPNPVREMLKINGEYGTVRVYNSNGSLIHSENYQGQTTIDFSTFAAGFYSLEIENDNGVFRQRVLK